MRVALEKIEGVAEAKVSLNDGEAVVAFEADNTVSIVQVWDAIRRNGFTPREARVLVRGRVERGSAGPELSVAGSGSRFTLAAVPALQPRIEQLVGEPAVIIDGTLEPPERREGVAAHRLRVIQLAVEDPPR